MSDEAAITVTLKMGAGFDAPWIVLRSNNPAEAQQQLDAIAAGGIGDAIGRAQVSVVAAFNAGAVLNARTEAAPVAAPDPWAPAPGGAPAAWDQPQAPQSTIQAAPPQSFPAAPQAYQPPQAAAAPAGVPGAPLVQGVPAKLVTNKPGGKPWQAWADPRPQQVTEYMEKTDDPNHPGLNQGTHKLWMFIR